MSSKTILHSAKYKISTQHRHINLLFDNCAQSSIITDDCAKELDLKICENPNQKLIVRTLTRNEPKPLKHADLKIHGTIFNFKVIDVNLMVECPKIELRKIWPSLEDKLQTEIESNLVSGQVDMIIGIDTLYSKAKYNSALNHPNMGLQIASTLSEIL